ncbi:MAG: carbohydrate ABC transporter permease [Candidatus Nanopelagicales bacterium]|nr:carbohydrate ABC transporter permease [Candidatus Nanopelagicales bacterium]MCF8540136.1 carbohydrate ABC transporter permease [Candidatus Nanopelagicales bacterium]MCF8551914.1 carbohydrate ABC transporter permease [Candidatus Nanopelagicales bacterium]
MSVEASEVVLIPEAKHDLRKGSRRRRVRRGSRTASLVVLAITIVWLIPTVGLFITSIRPVWESKNSGWWTVFTNPVITSSNYAEVLTGGSSLPDGITPFLFNTIAVAIPATVIPIVIACMAAYALVWIPFRGTTAIFVIIIALQVIPIQMVLLPLLDLFNSGWSLGPIPIVPNFDNPETGRSLVMNTFVPLWIVHFVVALPLAVFLMHNAISRFPKELFDAAKIDGASHFVIFRRLVLPLSMPAIAAFAIFQFVWVWNDYIVALTYASGSPDVAPITRYLAYLSGSMGVNQHLMTAGAFISMLIPIAIFFGLQRYFVRGLTAGAIEG